MSHQRAAYLCLGLLVAAAYSCSSDEELVPSVSIEDKELSGGKTTVYDTTSRAFALSARNLGREYKPSFFVGNSLFNKNWVQAPASTTARDGLGPLFNALACSSCHARDGRSNPYTDQGQPSSALLFRLSVLDAQGVPQPLDNYGDQFNPRAISDISPEGEVRVRFEELQGMYNDGTPYTLLSPSFSFEELAYGDLPKGTLVSPRVAPPVIGLGLLEAVPESTILKFADEADDNGDGISGRPNYVKDVVTGQMMMGRFGWKANQPGLLQQNSGAFLGDIGITSKFFPNEECSGFIKKECDKLPTGADEEGVEISMELLDDVTLYTAVLAVPARRDVEDEQNLRGERLFKDAQCTSCHVESMQTGTSKFAPALSNQNIRPYTDLLLHDMGPALADGRPDWGATGTEWRTPPLWGIGLIQRVNRHTRFLHDGRARSIEEAILWHGGEAKASQEAFLAMKKQDRDALLAFLQSL